MCLVIPNAVVIARPPIGAAGCVGLLAKPPAVVPVGIVIGAIHPDPDTVPKYAVTIIEAVEVVAAFREAAVLEPVAAVVTLYELTTITLVEMTTIAALCEPRSSCSGASIVTATHSPMTTKVTARHRAGMASTTTMDHCAAAGSAAATTAAASTSAITAPPAFVAYKRHSSITRGV